jgi:hypothetical protein
MFIAMNRFKVIKGSEAAFESVWLSRDSHLDKVPGFVEFHLLKGPEAEDHTLYASHTVWKNRATFEARPSPKLSAPRITKPAITSRSILGTRSSRGSRLFRRWEAAKAWWREIVEQLTWYERAAALWLSSAARQARDCCCSSGESFGLAP